DTLRAGFVPGPYGAREAVDGVVRDAHGVLFVLVGDDRQHRSEDFLLRNGHAVPDLAEHRGADVVATRRHAFRRFQTTGKELGALVDAFLDVAAHALELCLRRERAELGSLRQRIADA